MADYTAIKTNNFQMKQAEFLSRRIGHLDEANKLDHKFWLYVVEQANTEDFRIHRIQNPAQKANLFMLDDGWRSTAEPDESPE